MKNQELLKSAQKGSCFCCPGALQTRCLGWSYRSWKWYFRSVRYSIGRGFTMFFAACFTCFLTSLNCERSVKVGLHESSFIRKMFPMSPSSFSNVVMNRKPKTRKQVISEQPSGHTSLVTNSCICIPCWPLTDHGKSMRTEEEGGDRDEPFHSHVTKYWFPKLRAFIRNCCSSRCVSFNFL